MKLAIAAMCTVLLVLPANANAAKPIENLIDMPVPAKVDGSPRTIEEVRKAIILGCQARGWTPADDGEQKMRASILVRGKHYAEVEIPYTTTSYSIIYKSSRNLDYDEKKQKIHRNYNGWVGKLSGTIQKQFGVDAQFY